MIVQYNTEVEDSHKTIVVKEKEYEYKDSIGNSPDKIVDMMNELFRLDRMAEEYAYLICMNNKGRIIGLFEIAHGTVDSAIVSSRDVFMKALLIGATNIAVVHNHPSGDTTPSRQDDEVFKRLKSASEILTVKLTDYLIVGRGEYVSYHELGKCN